MSKEDWSGIFVGFVLACCVALSSSRTVQAGTVSRCADGTYSDVCVTAWRPPPPPVARGAKVASRRSGASRARRVPSSVVFDQQRRMLKR